MQQIKFIFSFVFILVGMGIVTISKIAEEVVPKSGYTVDLDLNYWIGALSIIGGALYIIKNSKTLKYYINVIKGRDQEYEENQQNGTNK